MEKLLLVSLVITILFCISKFVEMKLEKEFKPLKYVIRDAVIVFCSAVAALLGFSQMNNSIGDFMSIVTNNKMTNLSATEIFTDEPGF